MSLRLMYSPILLRSIAQVILLNHLQSQDLESGETTKSGKKLSPGSSLMKIYRVHSANYTKRVEDLFRGLVGLTLDGRRRLRKLNHIQKVKCTFYPVNWTWKLVELEKKDPLSASFKMLESIKYY